MSYQVAFTAMAAQQTVGLPEGAYVALNETLRAVATTRIRSLAEENRQLRDVLARALGEHRAADVRGNTHDRAARGH